MTEAIRFDHRGGVGGVTLNRPRALNALTLEMIIRYDAQLKAWATDDVIKAVLIEGVGGKAFCAGGDVLAVYHAGQAGDALAADFFRHEYTLNRRIHAFPKPYIALLDGITMGGGVGVSVHGDFRIVTENLMFSMPETGIGLFPDIGGSWFLPRCPGETGTYLALTGARLGAADAVALGLGTHFVPAARLRDFEVALYDAPWGDGPADATVRNLVEQFAEPAGPAPLQVNFAAIDRCFAYDDMAEILSALEAEGSDFAADTLKALATKSPTSLKVALAQMRRAEGLTFDERMTVEYRLSQAFMAGPDFYEGIRALLVDKDKSPAWSPPALADVTDAMVESHFESLGAKDLRFLD